MKTGTATRKASYIGTGVGIILFGLIGLFTGSLLGGAAGLNIAVALFGQPLTSALLPRLIVGVSMLVGVLVSAVVFIVGSTVTGWLIGYAVETIRAGKAEVVKAKAR